MLKLDARDIAILRVLSADERITNARLAQKVGLSASPCCNSRAASCRTG